MCPRETADFPLVRIALHRTLAQKFWQFHAARDEGFRGLAISFLSIPTTQTRGLRLAPGGGWELERQQLEEQLEGAIESIQNPSDAGPSIKDTSDAV